MASSNDSGAGRSQNPTFTRTDDGKVSGGKVSGGKVRGGGKARHIETGALWVQQAVARKKFNLLKQRCLG